MGDVDDVSLGCVEGMLVGVLAGDGVGNPDGVLDGFELREDTAVAGTFVGV